MVRSPQSHRATSRQAFRGPLLGAVHLQEAEMKQPDETAHAIDAAHFVRRRLAELLDARPAQRIVLAPGISVALKLLFARLGVKSLLMADEEYYHRRHFASLHV